VPIYTDQLSSVLPANTKTFKNKSLELISVNLTFKNKQVAAETITINKNVPLNIEKIIKNFVFEKLILDLVSNFHFFKTFFEKISLLNLFILHSNVKFFLYGLEIFIFFS
jgi:hypothetical protein